MLNDFLNNLVFIIALMMVVEAIFPFLSPRQWKLLLLRLLTVDNKSLRIMAFISMIAGVVVLNLVDATF